jgi:predicted nucleotidyltransferase
MADFEELLETLKKSAAVLREANVPFLLGGGLAAWARGGPETEHDLDLMVRPEDAERALEALAAAGFQTARPPEGWLYKAWDGDMLVDLIFYPSGGEVDDDMLARGEELDVHAVRMQVMALEDVMVTKLLSMREHEVDYDGVLEIGRALREQIDWQAVRSRTDQSPYARTFFFLAEELGVLEPSLPRPRALRSVPAENLPDRRRS